MARRHARIMLSIWDDPDFTALTSGEQVTYFSLISSRDLSWCGVLPYLPKRLVRNSRSLTERKVVAALDVLTEKRFIVVDRDTDEMTVRRFIHHDEVMRQPNVAKAMARALDLVHSQRIRDVIVDELRRELTEEPDYAGWGAIALAFPELFELVNAKGSRNPSMNPSRKAS